MKSCFVVSPLGEIDSAVQKRSDLILEKLILPAVAKCGYGVIRADYISSPDSITIQIINHLTDSDLVIADLSGRDTNVYYEVGIRHAIGKPIIHLMASRDSLPFDIASFQVIQFEHTDSDSLRAARRTLEKSVMALEGHPESFQGLLVLASELRARRESQQIALRAYLSDSDPRRANQVSEAIASFTEALNLMVIEDPPAESGSWWKQWLARSRDVLSQPEMAERLRQAEMALQTHALARPQAEVDQKQAEAVAALIQSLESIPNAAIQIGSLLVIKSTEDGKPSISVRSLTQSEMIEIERNPSVLQNPKELLSRLSEDQ